MVDSVGLNLLVSLIKAAQQQNRKARIRTVNTHVRRALKFTRLDQLAEVVG
jgi:anti-anti-sigma regulatory factor